MSVRSTPSEGAEEGNALRAAERRIAEHPAARKYAACTSLRLTIEAVFVPNWVELLTLFRRAASDENLAIELVQNVRASSIRDQFHAVITRSLHNYLASATTLVDHVRRLMRNRTGAIAEEFSRRKAEVIKNPEIPFMQDLRNFTLHRTLPFLGHRVSFTQLNTPEQKMESEVELGTAALLEWNVWSAASRQFLNSQSDAVAIRAVVKRHGRLLIDLNVWLCNELMRSIDLEEVNRLIVERNAIVMGVDFETAQRLTSEWSIRHSTSEPD